jgi:hypothetical protein
LISTHGSAYTPVRGISKNILGSGKRLHLIEKAKSLHEAWGLGGVLGLHCHAHNRRADPLHDTERGTLRLCAQRRRLKYVTLSQSERTLPCRQMEI